MVHDFKAFPELTNSQLELFRFESPHVQIEDDFEAEVTKVHDGDTVTLRTNFRDFDFPLRFLDIDAPELSVGGALTRDWLANRVLGKRVTVLIDRENRVGRYGRLLGRILHGGSDVGEEELRLGLASTFAMRREGQLVPLDKIFSLRQWFS